MAISLFKALKDVRSDEHWKKKIAILGYLIGIPIYISSFFMQYAQSGEKTNIILWLISFVVYILLTIYATGFNLKTMNGISNSNNWNLAEFGEKNLMLTGLKGALSYFVYGIIFGILMAITYLLLMLGCALIFGALYFLLATLLHLSTGLVQVLSTILSICIGVYFICHVIMFMSTAYACFFKTLKFKDLINIKKHHEIIRTNYHVAWTLAGKFILFSILGTLIVTTCIVTVIPIIALPFVMSYLGIASVFLIVQYGKEIQIENYLQ